MANNKFDHELFPVFDQSLLKLKLASEMLREAWRQVFNRPIRNIFRKIDFPLYERISDEALVLIKEARSGSGKGGTIVLQLFHPIFCELDRYARFLETYGIQLQTCISKLIEKSNGHTYPYSEYELDNETLDRSREQLVESQQRLNQATKTFLAEFDPADIPEFPDSRS